MGEIPLQWVREIESRLVRGPFGRMLDLRLVRMEADFAAVAMPFRPEVTTAGDTVHGGALAALVDTAGSAAAWASAEITPEHRGATVGFSISYLTAARGSEVVARATVRRRGRQLTTSDVSVVDADGREVAAALVTYKLEAP